MNTARAALINFAICVHIDSGILEAHGFGAAVRRARNDPWSWPWRRRLIAGHNEIAKAIGERDPQRAAGKMRQHLDSVEHRLFGDPEEIVNEFSRDIG